LTLMLSGRAPKIVWSGDRYDPRWSSAAVSEWVLKRAQVGATAITLVTYLLFLGATCYVKYNMATHSHNNNVGDVIIYILTYLVWFIVWPSLSVSRWNWVIRVVFRALCCVLSSKAVVDKTQHRNIHQTCQSNLSRHAEDSVQKMKSTSLSISIAASVHQWRRWFSCASRPAAVILSIIFDLDIVFSAITTCCRWSVEHLHVNG